MLLQKISRENLRGTLLLKNLTLRSFAKKHGFNENTVLQVVSRYVGKGDGIKPPTGKLTISILNKLEEYL